MRNLRILLALAMVWTIAGVAQADLIITEIMKDPLDYSDSYAEWFEIFNNSASSVDMEDYTITDDGGQSHTISGLVVGAYGVITLGKYADPNFNGEIAHDYIYGGTNLDNGADEIILRDAGGTLVDEVWYDDGTLWPDADGASLMVIDYDLDNNDPTNWRSSSIAWADNDFGSPRELNEGPYSIHDLVISEIMYDPHATSDTYAEWFEVYNAGGSAANMRLCYITDGGSNTYRWVDHYLIQPGEYAVLGKYSDENFNGHIDEDWVYSGTTLDQTVDEIILTDLLGNQLDIVEYDENSGWPLAYGASIYLNSLGADNNDPANWEMSTVTWPNSDGDFGSPGEANQPGYTMPELVISEIMYDPYAASDTYAEWFEVYNAGADSVNFRLWVFTDNGGNSFIPQTDYWSQPGEYFLFAKYPDPNFNGNVEEDYDFDGMALDNTEDEIIITDLRGNLIDMVEYSPANLFPDPYGASIFLTDLGLDNSVGTNWAISTIQWPGSDGDFGSPGAANQAVAIVPNISITEIMADAYAASDTYAEWFEIYNHEADSVNMRYWDFVDDGSNTHTFTQDLWIHAGEYMLLAKYGDPAFNGGVDEDYAYTGHSLDDTADEIILIDNRGNTIDEVWYDASFIKHFGASFYVLDIEADNNVPENWAISDIQWPGSDGDFGSPGEANQTPQAMPEIVITEIMINPFAASDTYAEWFELYNAGPESVNMRYWEFFDDGTNTHTIITDVIIPSNGYYLMAKYGDPAFNGGVDEDYVYGGIGFDDTIDELRIEDIHYEIIDEVAYTGAVEWPHPEGASIYILNPFEDNSLGTSWTAATQPWPGSDGDFGSPGVANFDAYLILTVTEDSVGVGGGDIVYDGRLINNLPNTYENVEYWTEVITPTAITVPFSSLFLTVYPFMDVTVTDNIVPIPGWAPGGTYSFVGRIGYPTIYISDEFEFTKDGPSADGWTTEMWMNLFEIAGNGDALSALPVEFNVGNAYPNPFNPTASIEIALPEASQVNVTVFNTIGQRVATVASGSYQAGWHTFMVDGSHLASGVYFVQAEVQGQLNQMQKIVLMK
jgi:Lamin Tail Domain/Secretion system C-terminal sorting domain